MGDVYLSGLNKGVLSGDLGLVKTCFDRCWDDNNDKLRWLTLLHVAKYAYYLAGKIPDNFDKKDWLSFYYQFALIKKCKDPTGLVNLSHHNYSHAEIDSYAFINDNGIIKELLSCSDYCEKCIDVYLKKISCGGSLVSKHYYCAALSLLISRPVDLISVNKLIKKGTLKWKKKNKEIIEYDFLPLYIYDYDTPIGNDAVSCIKDYTTDQILDAWKFYDDLDYTKDIKYKDKDLLKPFLFYDSVWYVEYLKTLKQNTMDIDCWKKIKPIITKQVRRLL